MNRLASFSVFLCLVVLAASTSPLHAQQRLNGHYSFAQFAHDSTQSLVEFYYDIPSTALTYHTRDGATQIATVMCSLSADQWGIVRGAEKWMFRAERTAGETGERGLVGVRSLVLAPGEYRFTAVVLDSATPHIVDTVTVNFTVHAFSAPKPTVSSIQLAQSLRYAAPSESSPFIKGGIELIPNARDVYQDGALTLVYYAEVYNLQQLKPTDSLFVETYIIDQGGIPVYHRVVPRPHSVPAIAVVESLPLDAVNSGKYRVIVRAITAHGGSVRSDTAIARHDFSVVNSALPAFVDPMDAPDVASSEFVGKSEMELDTLFSQCVPIATKEEQETFASISGAAPKAEFMFRFWDSRNRTGTPYTLKEYHAALDFVNAEFKSMGKQGWRTDRGKVFLKYGPPSTPAEKHYFGVDSKPYEIWFYNNIEGGVQFVFVDIGGYGEFKLVHSDKRGEIRDDNWRERYAKNLMKGQ